MAFRFSFEMVFVCILLDLPVSVHRPFPHVVVLFICVGQHSSYRNPNSFYVSAKWVRRRLCFWRCELLIFQLIVDSTTFWIFHLVQVTKRRIRLSSTGSRHSPACSHRLHLKHFEGFNLSPSPFLCQKKRTKQKSRHFARTSVPLRCNITAAIPSRQWRSRLDVEWWVHCIYTMQYEYTLHRSKSTHHYYTCMWASVLNWRCALPASTFSPR